jgi:hypothetical protein
MKKSCVRAGKETADPSTALRSGRDDKVESRASREKGRLGCTHPNTNFIGKSDPPFCHPDRSAAEWRDLQFNGPLMEMFSPLKGDGNGPPKQPSPKYVHPLPSKHLPA